MHLCALTVHVRARAGGRTPHNHQVTPLSFPSSWMRMRGAMAWDGAARAAGLLALQPDSCANSLPHASPMHRLQVITILRSRMTHVDKMMGIYQERMQYAKQVAELAFMSASTGQPQRLGMEDHSMMGVLLRHGYLYCAKYMVTVHRLMDLIKVGRSGFDEAWVKVVGIRVFPRAPRVCLVRAGHASA